MRKKEMAQHTNSKNKKKSATWGRWEPITLIKKNDENKPQNDILEKHPKIKAPFLAKYPSSWRKINQESLQLHNGISTSQ